MSGLFGIMNLDGQPVNQNILQQMGAWLAYRGPDAEHIWSNENIGLGHTTLQTLEKPVSAEHSLSLENRIHITASARIDDRYNLIQQLNKRGYITLDNESDTTLILYAYLVWGKDCVSYLLGDFSFAIYDCVKHQLFCARDHLGVEQFYYAYIDKTLVFSNSMNCLLLYPLLSHELNDIAVSDFLLFGENKDFNTTFLKHIQRLPPAHILTANQEGIGLKRYWTLPFDNFIRYQNTENYIEHFKSIFKLAIADRLRTDNIAVSMSGGLDATAIAAVSKELLLKQKTGYNLCAFTSVFAHLFPDEELYYSHLAAEFIGIPLHVLYNDDIKPFPDWKRDPLLIPEPYFLGPMWLGCANRYERMANFGRVILTGMGADSVLRAPTSYTSDETLVLREGLGIWHPYLEWLQPDFATSISLKERWKQICAPPKLIHPTHSIAYWELTSPTWSNITFALNDAQALPCESRHPFMDLRLINYILAIPPDLCSGKMILRESMGTLLPSEILSRRKTPLAGDAFQLFVSKHDKQWIYHLLDTPQLACYVDKKQITKEFDIFSQLDYRYSKWAGKPLRRVLSLAWWLHNRPNPTNRAPLYRELVGELS